MVKMVSKLFKEKENAPILHICMIEDMNIPGANSVILPVDVKIP